MLGSYTEFKLQVEASLRTFDSLGIAGSELGRPALAGLSSLTTWVEETIAKVQLLDDVTAQMVAIERSATTRAVTSISRAIDEQQRLTRLKECMAESLVLQREILFLLSEVFERFKGICTAVQELDIYFTALVQERWASMLEQAGAAHAADPKEATDLTDGATDITAAAESDSQTRLPRRRCGQQRATGDAEYNDNWNGTGSSDDPALATLRLLHSARKMVDTSRWWALRWPNSAISLLGTACGLNTEGMFKLLRKLRKVMVHHVRELWAVVMGRRHAADNVAKRAPLKEEWLKLSRVLANMRIPGLTLLENPFPVYPVGHSAWAEKTWF